MLGIFKEKLINAPKELDSLASLNSSFKSKLPHEILHGFMSYNSPNAFCMNLASDALIVYSPSNQPSIHQRLFSGVDRIHNLSQLNKQYGLSKLTNKAIFIIEAYRTFPDRGPYPTDPVLKEHEGNFGFVIYDNKDGTVFVASVLMVKLDCSGVLQLMVQ